MSTADQDCAAQIRDLAAAGCAEIVTETASGSDRARPALARLLASLGPGDVLVVVRLDRLARSTAHLLAVVDQLGRLGAGLRSLRDPIDTTTAAGRFGLVVLAAVAELERGLIIERTRAGLAAARDRGRIGGHPGLRARDRDAIAQLAAARAAAARGRALAALGPVLEEITGAASSTSWERIARRIAAAGGPAWSAARLRRTAARLGLVRGAARGPRAATAARTPQPSPPGR